MVGKFATAPSPTNQRRNRRIRPTLRTSSLLAIKCELE
jgi:hypothetical protein